MVENGCAAPALCAHHGWLRQKTAHPATNGLTDGPEGGRVRRENRPHSVLHAPLLGIPIPDRAETVPFDGGEDA
ncbi:MAG: hypothetical protein ACKOET_16330, partial [Verrucomicrobiota bacterium]